MVILRKAVAVVITDNLDRVLLVRRGKLATEQEGQWENPGGSVEEGETLEGAAKREVLEELGLELVSSELLYTDRFSTKDGHDWEVTVFGGKISGEPKLQNEESSDLAWFAKEELAGLPLASYTRADFVRFGWIK